MSPFSTYYTTRLNILQPHCTYCYSHVQLRSYPNTQKRLAVQAPPKGNNWTIAYIRKGLGATDAEVEAIC